MTQRNGFTLLEILIASAIFMTVMVVAIGVFGTTLSSSSTSSQLRTTAQTARYVFESIAREIRSAHGLIVSAPDGNQTVIVKPFDYRTGTSSDELEVNQVKKSLNTATGETVYGITRKIYKINHTTPPTLAIIIKETTSSSLTLNQLALLSDASFTVKNQSPSGAFISEGTNMIPDELSLLDFRVERWVGYATDPDDQKTQPYMQLKLTVGSRASGFANQADKKAQTTLMTTVVPRDFSSPFEVVQSRATGGGQ
jgi:type II secretory pathway pseudopilin PulG